MLPAVAEAFPSFIRVGVVRLTVVPDTVTPAATLMLLAPPVPELAVNVVPAVESTLNVTSPPEETAKEVNAVVAAFTVTLAPALRDIDVALVTPPSVSEPPLTTSVRAAPAASAAVFRLPATEPIVIA